MRTVFFFLSLLSAAAIASTETDFVGTANIVDLGTASTHQEKIYLRRIVDPEKEALIELACVVEPGGKPYLFPVYMHVQNGRITEMAEAPSYRGKLSGTGELQGTPWAWTYLHFSMHWPGDVSIEDDNYLGGVTEQHLIARKQISVKGRPVQVWDADTVEAAPNSFQKQIEEAGCPTF